MEKVKHLCQCIILLMRFWGYIRPKHWITKYIKIREPFPHPCQKWTRLGPTELHGGLYEKKKKHFKPVVEKPGKVIQMKKVRLKFTLRLLNLILYNIYYNNPK